MLNSYLSITYVFPRHRPKQPPSRGFSAPKSVRGIRREDYVLKAGLIDSRGRVTTPFEIRLVRFELFE